MGTFNFGAGAENYNGEVLEELLTLTAQTNQTFEEKLVHIKPQIQKKFTLPSVKLGSIIQDRKPTPDSSEGTYTFGERYLEPKDFMIYIEFNPRDFEQYYKPFQSHGNLVFRELAPEIQATMIRLLMEGKDEYIDNAIWRSATPTEAAKITAAVGAATSDIGGDNEYGKMKYWNGVIDRLLLNANSSDANEIHNGKVKITGNAVFADGKAVEDELYKMWKALPVKLRNSPGLKFVMDWTSWDAYDQYLTSKESKYVDNTTVNVRTFKGKRIVPLTGLPDNTIILAKFTDGRDSNLWMSVDVADDINVIQVEKKQANSELWFFKALMKVDVNVVKPGEIVAHLPYTYNA